jgi:hypothetical protein
MALLIQFEVVSGHPLLQQAEMDSAKQSQFDCFQCAGSLTSCALMYTFKIHERGSCCVASPGGTSDKEPAESLPKVIPSPYSYNRRAFANQDRTEKSFHQNAFICGGVAVARATTPPAEGQLDALFPYVNSSFAGPRLLPPSKTRV